MDLVIREAKISESASLTAISYEAKRYWNYPEEYFTVWKNELTITQEYIEENMVFVAEIDNVVIGYLSIVEIRSDLQTGNIFIKRGYWLEHIFIKPEFIGKRVGTELIAFVKDLCKKKKIGSLLIFSDPNAKGFYAKVGARFVEESPSSIDGRTVPVYELVI